MTLPQLKVLSKSDDPRERDEAWDRYLSSCSDYLKRQILIYQNWPQHKFDGLGYLDEKVFHDMNA